MARFLRWVLVGVLINNKKDMYIQSAFYFSWEDLEEE